MTRSFSGALLYRHSERGITENLICEQSELGMVFLVIHNIHGFSLQLPVNTKIGIKDYLMVYQSTVFLVYQSTEITFQDMDFSTGIRLLEVGWMQSLPLTAFIFNSGQITWMRLRCPRHFLENSFRSLYCPPS